MITVSRYGVKVIKANGWEHRCAARATAPGSVPTHEPAGLHTSHVNSKNTSSSSEDVQSRVAHRIAASRPDPGAVGTQAGPPVPAEEETSQPQRVVYAHEKDLVYLLSDDVRNARFVVDLRNLRGLYREWLVDQPRLVVDMLYRVPSLRTPKGVDRATVQKEEAQELLLLISKESFRDPRILCRALASTSRVNAVPTEPMLEAIYDAMRSGLVTFNLHNTVGSSGLFNSIARLFPGSSRFDEDLDTALQRVIHHQKSPNMTVRQHSMLLWALARIGFQSSTVETIISNCCMAIAKEANRELQAEQNPGMKSSSGGEYFVEDDTSTDGRMRLAWQADCVEEEELVKSSGFDLSWLPGGQPEHFVMLKAPLNSRLAAGRFIDINAALTSSSDLPEASEESSSRSSEGCSDTLSGASAKAPEGTKGLPSREIPGTASPSTASEDDDGSFVADERLAEVQEQGHEHQGLARAHNTEAPIRRRYTVNTTDSSSATQANLEDDQRAGQESEGPAQEEEAQEPAAAAAADETQPQQQKQQQTQTMELSQQANKAEVSRRRGGRRERVRVREGTFVEKHGQQTLSNAVWALATFEAEGLEGVHDAITACCQLYCAMRPQDVHLQVAANMAWASNLHGIHRASVLHHTAACVQLMNAETRTKPQSVSNILYAMAEARYRDKATVRILTLWAAEHIGAFKDQERANLAWACARLNCSNRGLFQALRPHVEAYVAESEAWLSQVHRTALPKRRVSSMCAVLGQFLWSYSLLGHVDAALFRTICRPLAMLGRIRTEAAAGVPVQPHSVSVSTSTSAGTDILDHLGETILTQVATAWMSLEVIGEHLEETDDSQIPEQAAEDMTQELVQNALGAMRTEAHKTARSHSAVHDSICEVLQVLGVPYRRNVLLQNELLCIQTLVGLEGAEPVAIILNRGHDLTITRPLEVVGNAAWKATQLRARGVRVVEVNGDSWRHLSMRQRAAHLQQLLSPFAVQ